MSLYLSVEMETISHSIAMEIGLRNSPKISILSKKFAFFT